jgi:cyanophycinase
VNFRNVLLLILLLPFGGCFAQDSNIRQLNVSIGIAGDTTDVHTITQAGYLLMSGSTDVDEALKWMIDKSGGGDFLIIRAKKPEQYFESD